MVEELKIELQFSATDTENHPGYLYIAKNHIEERVRWYAQILSAAFVQSTVNSWNLDKSYPFFPTNVVAWVLQWG